VGEADTRGTYVFEGNHSKKRMIDPRDAVVFARQQLLQETTKKGFNVLLLERHVFIGNNLYLFDSCYETSWQVTVYRRGKQHRIEVQYSARRKASIHSHFCYPLTIRPSVAAHALGKLPTQRSPPFMGVLHPSN